MDQRRQEELRAQGAFSKSNKTSMPYNPINLQYGDGCVANCARAPRSRLVSGFLLRGS